MRIKKIMYFNLLLPLFVNAQWSSSSAINNSICIQPYNQQNAKIEPDGNGGAIIVWEDYRNDGLQADIYAQRIDKNGYIKWTNNGISICTDLSHQSNPNIHYSNGQVIIIWNDHRNGNTDIYAQMIDTSGNIKWPINGVPVISKNFPQKDGKVIMDANYNTYIVYEDSSAGNWDIYAQKLDINGNQLWTSNGAVVCNAGYSQINPRVEFASTGGIYVVWQDKRNGVDYDIYAQKLDANGVRQWNVANNGIWVCSTVGAQSNPKIEPFGTGFITVWQDLRNGGDYDIYAQYISDSGIGQWTTNGKIICNSLNNQSAIDMKNNKVDGAYIIWKDNRNTAYYDIYMQKITYSGTAAWTNNGIVISNANYDQINPNIEVDESGNALVTWQDSSAGEWNIYASKVDKTGNILWTTAVSTAQNNQTDPKNISDNNGGTIIVWKDKRNELTTKWDIYTQKIFSNGSLTNVEEITKNVSIKLWPNPVQDKLYIQLINSFQKKYYLQIVNILGEELVKYELTSSLKVLDLVNIPSGIYFIKLSDSSQNVWSYKLIKL